MNEQKGFVLYHDICKVFDDVSDEEAGKLIKEIVKKARQISQGLAKEPTGFSGLMKAVYNPFEAHLLRDRAEWEKIRERNISNGKKGGRPSKKPKLTQANPEKPVKVKVKVKDKVKNITPLPPLPSNWDLFLQFRKEIKKPVTEAQKAGAIKKAIRLAEESNCTPEQILDQSIENGWRGLFHLKGKENGNQQNTSQRAATAIAEGLAEWEDHLAGQQGGEGVARSNDTSLL